MISIPGTELFVVRAFPRRLFNIQAVDGVSTEQYGQDRLPCLPAVYGFISHPQFEN